jgi:metal-responsive CopG/Arc/MetJ family transcriptional regulator
MNTAISLPNELFEQADALAERLGLSRSALYATAVAEFVAKHRGGDVTARLDAVYDESESRVVKSLSRSQEKSVAANGQDDW